MEANDIEIMTFKENANPSVLGSEYQKGSHINHAVKNAHFDIDDNSKRRKPKDNKNYES